MSGTRKPPQPPACVPGVDSCPDCLRAANAKYPHARDCPQNETSRRRRGIDWHRSGLFADGATEDLGDGARDQLLRHLLAARRAGSLAQARHWVDQAMGVLLTPGYLEALREKLRP